MSNTTVRMPSGTSIEDLRQLVMSLNSVLKTLSDRLGSLESAVKKSKEK